jgi:2-polyprenyl-3-methyl-5-hydroxy-6-metoxy-1,4-benzoquinol methylase
LQQPSDTTVPVESGPEESVQPSPAFDYSTIPPGYYDAVFRRRRGIQSKWHHLKFQRVVREVSGCRRVLDVGCGPGTLLGILGDDHDSAGIDVSQQQIEYARRVYGNAYRSFFGCTPSQLPDDLEPFDAITAVELIEHLPPDLVEDTVRQATERLRPGGKLVLTTPNFKSAWPLIERFVNRFGEVEYKFQHINKYSHARLCGLLDSLELQDIEVSAYLLVSPFAALLGWRLADYVARLEAGFLVRNRGLLLVATGRKPA